MRIHHASCRSNGSVMVHQQSQDDEVIISSAGGYGGGCQPITQGGITRYDHEARLVSTAGDYLTFLRSRA